MDLESTNPIRFPARLTMALVVLILAGCATVGPDYVAPETTVANDWHTPLTSGLNAENIDPQALTTWWSTLNDPELSALIDRAVNGNLDIKEARARIREARARRGLAGAGRFPTLEAAGSSMDRVVKVNIFLRRAEDWGTVNGIYRTYFKKDFPARSTAITGLQPPTALIEMECIAMA